ncbi:hypothetical protein HDU77_002085 [Chytriomyces hyalinus]|nr:hypothetical protein HDU77_002085 [Chytriomyces hyalinus]
MTNVVLTQSGSCLGNLKNNPSTDPHQHHLTNMKVAVFGGTQGCGKEFLIQALSAGHEATVLARSPAKLDDLAIKPKIIEGNVKDASLVRQVVAGQDAVVICLGVSRMNLEEVKVCSEGTALILEAMKAEGVRRVLVLTGANPSEPSVFQKVLMWVISSALADKDLQTKMVEDSGLDWILVKPPSLTNGPLTGTYNVGPDIKATTLSRKDVGHFMLQNLESNEFLKKAVIISDK